MHMAAGLWERHDYQEKQDASGRWRFWRIFCMGERTGVKRQEKRGLGEMETGKKYLVSAEEMKRCDGNTITHFGISSLVLMEKAALAVADEIEKRFGKGQRILVVAGCGNNGGDGIAAGRILWQRGHRVAVYLCGNRERCSGETRTQIAIMEKYGCPVQSKMEDVEYDIIVDALFGIGLSRSVEGIHAQAIERINRSGAYVCAVDIASGICTDSGEVLGTAVRADLTVTFAFEKLGHVLYPGCEYAGEVLCADIGITKDSFLGMEPGAYAYTGNISGWLPERNAGGNKGSFGKVLVIAGSVNMSGACELCARSAYRMGAGMVKIITPEENRVIVQQNIPEAMLRTYCIGEIREDFYQGLQEDMDWADCMVIGPGLGKSSTAYKLLKTVMSQSHKPLVIDADGLNLIAEKEELAGLTGGGRQIILTPHLGEFARLCGCTVKEAKKRILSAPLELAEKYGCVVVCKDARTVVADCSENTIYVNTTGNDGMATAGMGDVLAGVIGGLLAQGMVPLEAARLGVYVHGLAGDMAAENKGRYALMAGDMIEQLEKITWDGGSHKSKQRGKSYNGR